MICSMKKLLGLVLAVWGCEPKSSPTGQSAAPHVSVRTISTSSYALIMLTIDSVNNVYCYTVYQNGISCINKDKR
jgi:hypothetical protein